MSWHTINKNPKHVAVEREKARKLRKSQWWLTKLNQGLCHYCGKKFPPTQLTMDHIVPVARGGKSTHGNTVPACKDCNAKKRLDTPVEKLFEELAKQKSKNSSDEDPDGSNE